MRQQHYVLSRDPAFLTVIAFIKANDLEMSCHVNRTRFWLDSDSTVYLEFLLRYADSCPRVESHF